MATNQRKSKCRLIGKKELAYLLSRLRTTDTTVMRASVLKLVEELERNHIDFFPSRRATWDHWKRAESLDVLLSFLLTGFCDLIQKHIGGGERFANFLVSWYNFVGSIAVHSLCTEGSSVIWRQIPELSGVCTEARLSTALQSASMRFSRSRWAPIGKPKYYTIVHVFYV